MNLPVTLTAALETAFNRYVELDPLGKARLAQLEGKVIAVDILGLDMSLYFLPAATQVHIMSHFEGTADTHVSGAPFSLLRMSLSDRGEQQLFSGDVKITGDIETGQQFNRILKQLDIDWEEHLSHLTGDVIAHQLGRGFRSLLNWGQQTRDSLLKDTGEYVVEESDLVVSAYELEDFSAHVATTHNDVERIQARIQRLQHRIAESLS